MRIIISFLLLLMSALVNAQTLRGIVLSADNRQPVPAASVFLSNTGVGTITRDDGRFELNRFPSGRYELVVTSLGYETYSVVVQSASLPEQLQILLKPKARELQEVVVEPYEKNGWEKWGKFFLENFIGISAYANEVRLKNPGVIRFRHNKKTNTLNAYADEALVIENNALGYVLRYQLEQFEYRFSANMLLFQGFPFFEEMVSRRSGKMKRWQSNRENVYEGSLMHFYRSLFRNKLVEEGFELRRSVDVVNQEKARIKEKMRAQMKGAVQQGNKVVFSGGTLGVTADSATYQNRVMRQPDKMEVLYKPIIPADSIAYAIDSVTVGLYFKDYLHVTYPKKKEPEEIAKALGKQEAGDALVSKLQLLNNKEIAVLANGSFFEPTDIIAHGYWAYWERMATMLPLDYKPIRNNKAP
ncbi:MAG: carboxypeptidase-like regulatory domain-containing protein [Chitinophagaceae bacterium]|nr:carboxypeptidase-like regulatory domain-containing protein [Chitinophagaceae bacterium]